MKGFYVIVKRDWEYNDEYYHRNDGFKTKVAYNEDEESEALRVCAEMNAKANLEIVGDPSWEYTREQCDLDSGPIEFFEVLFVPLREERPKPKFKVGDFVKGKYAGSLPVEGRICRTPIYTSGGWTYALLVGECEHSPVFESSMSVVR